MKLSIKNLKGEVFTVEVEPTDTVLTLKGKIQEQKNLQADTLKIVYKGKTIHNDDQIQKLGIKETDFLVVMAQVQKPQPKAEQKQEVAKVEEKNEAEKVQNKAQEKTQVKEPVLSGQSDEAQINELMSMGFPRQKCVQALRAAFNNTERAVEYLINGIPTNVRPPPPPSASQSSGQLPPGGAQNLGVGHLRALFSHPQFAQIRNLIRSNPNALQPILAQISQSSPQIYNLITQHPEEFQRIILGEGEDEGGEQGVPGQQQAPPGTILVSPADEQAINRLRTLGFSKIECAQAYFACDKNEDLAANLLFDRLANGDIEMEPQGSGGHGGSGGSGGSGGQGGQGGQGGHGQGGEEDDDNLFN